MKNQTAVDWLKEQLKENMLTPAKELDKLIEQAKQMEKQQIIDAVNIGFDEGAKFPEDIKLNNAEEYYKQTYNL
jgi:predicted adenine nucleotide alpha hydrolase (AANH) superfamily ATPase